MARRSGAEERKPAIDGTRWAGLGWAGLTAVRRSTSAARRVCCACECSQSQQLREAWAAWVVVGVPRGKEDEPSPLFGCPVSASHAVKSLEERHQREMLRQSSSPLVRAATAAAAGSTTAAHALAASLRATTLVQTRLAHRRVPLPYDAEHGLPGFLSPNALRTVAVDWQQGVLARLDELVRGQSSGPGLSPV